MQTFYIVVISVYSLVAIGSTEPSLPSTTMTPGSKSMGNKDLEQAAKKIDAPISSNEEIERHLLTPTLPRFKDAKVGSHEHKTLDNLINHERGTMETGMQTLIRITTTNVYDHYRGQTLPPKGKDKDIMHLMPDKLKRLSNTITIIEPITTIEPTLKKELPGSRKTEPEKDTKIINYNKIIRPRHENRTGKSSTHEKVNHCLIIVSVLYVVNSIWHKY